nr:16S rRNA (guanine(966)-N(2))-methyltransferase RsmD [Holdemania sp. Marseille-P2844]
MHTRSKKMRIVAGKFRSRLIQAPKGDQTRPTLDKVKEAVFSRIGPYFDGGVMLDLFAGSGSMGLEALSRGVEHVYFVDRSPAAAAVIKANIASLQVEAQCDVWKCDSFAALRRLAGMGVQLDLVYLDPPYQKQQLHKIMQQLDALNLIRDHGQVILESLKEDEFDEAYHQLHRVKEATYGISRISYYRKETEL